MVMDKTGMPSFLVRRIDAETPFRADLRARCRGPRGSSRFMVLFGSADCKA